MNAEAELRAPEGRVKRGGPGSGEGDYCCYAPSSE